MPDFYSTDSKKNLYLQPIPIKLIGGNQSHQEREISFSIASSKSIWELFQPEVRYHPRKSSTSFNS